MASTTVNIPVNVNVGYMISKDFIYPLYKIEVGGPLVGEIEAIEVPYAYRSFQVELLNCTDFFHCETYTMLFSFQDYVFYGRFICNHQVFRPIHEAVTYQIRPPDFIQRANYVTELTFTSIGLVEVSTAKELIRRASEPDASDEILEMVVLLNKKYEEIHQEIPHVDT